VADGKKHQEQSTNNLCVEAKIAKSKYGPIVLVWLAIGSVKSAI